VNDAPNEEGNSGDEKLVPICSGEIEMEL